MVQNITATQSQITGLVTASQAPAGALQASQSGNQLLAVIARELADVTALLAAQGRAASLAGAGTTANQAQAQSQITTFLTTGAAYQPQPVYDVPLMRRPALNPRSLGRAGAVLLVAAAILASAISIHSADRSHRLLLRLQPPFSATSTPAMERCRDLGTAAENDAECLAVWAQLRQRFFESKPPVGARS